MKTPPFLKKQSFAALFLSVLISLVLCELAPALLGEDHHFSAIQLNATGAISLSLDGTVPSQFKSYFDLYHVESSEDLTIWNLLAILVRTNAITNSLVYLDNTAAGHDRRFYRTSSSQAITPFLPPSGPYAVGMTTRLLNDDTRTNRFKIPTNSSFQVTFWYPAQAQPSAELAAYMAGPLARSRTYWQAYTNRVPSFVTFATPNVPLLASAKLFPVILYSHGLGNQNGLGVRTENTRRLVELASHGYVIAALDHTDTYATVFPDDRLIVSGFNNDVVFANITPFLTNRVRDAQFLIDYLTHAKTSGNDSLFSGKLDLDRVGILGWSFGGGTAAESGRLEPRIKAVALLDGFLSPSPALLKNGLPKPFIALNSPTSGLGADAGTIFNKAAQDAFWLYIKTTDHESFTDYLWNFSPTATTRRQALTMDRCVVSFFDRYLGGQEDHFLDGPGADYPDISSFKHK